MAAASAQQRIADPDPFTEPTAGLDLSGHGLLTPGRIYARLSAAQLAEQAVLRGEGLFTERGALVAYTGERTGRSPQDRYLVADPGEAKQIWWGPVNRAMDAAAADRLF